MLTTPKINEKPGPCSECGGLVQPGQGHVWWQAAPDDGGDVLGRAEAGYRVTHADEKVCAEVRAERARVHQEKVLAAKERAQAEREAFDADLATLRAEVDRLVAAHGLVPVPSEACTSPFVVGGDVATVLLDRTVYPKEGGFSRGVCGHVAIHAKDEVIASYGTNEGVPHVWASPALIERGQKNFRVAQWWAEGPYKIDSYPGPGVPKEALSPEELATVQRLTVRKVEAKVSQTVAQLKAACEAHTSIARLANMHGGSIAVEINPSDVAVYVATPGTPITGVVTVTFPAAHYDTKGKLKRSVARWVPEEVWVHNGFMVKMVTKCEVRP